MNELTEFYIDDANTLSNNGSYAEAILYYTKCISNNPWLDSLVLNNRAIAFMHLSMYSRALEDIDTAISLTPDVALLYCTRAQINLLRADTENTFSTLAILQTVTNDYLHAAELDLSKSSYIDLAERTKKLREKMLFDIQKASADVVNASNALTSSKPEKATAGISSAINQTIFGKHHNTRQTSTAQENQDVTLSPQASAPKQS